MGDHRGHRHRRKPNGQESHGDEEAMAKTIDGDCWRRQNRRDRW
jgi:hypothetical protein